MLNKVIDETLDTGKHALVHGAGFYVMYKALDAVNTIGTNLMGTKIPAPAITAAAGLGLAVALKSISKNKIVHEAADLGAMAAVFALLMRNTTINGNVDKLLAPLKRVGVTKGYEVGDDAGLAGYEPALMGYGAAETTEGYEYADPRTAMRGYTSRHALVAA